MHASIVLVTASLHCSKAAASAPRCHRSQPSASAAGADGASAAQQHPSPGERLRVPRSRRRAHREGADARSVAQVGTAAVDGVRRPQQHVPRLAQVLRRWVRRAVVRDEGRQGGRHRALLVGPEALRVVPEEAVHGEVRARPVAQRAPAVRDRLEVGGGCEHQATDPAGREVMLRLGRALDLARGVVAVQVPTARRGHPVLRAAAAIWPPRDDHAVAIGRSGTAARVEIA